MALQASMRVPSAAANGKHGHTLISDEKFQRLYGLALRLQLQSRAAGSGENGAAWLRGREAALAGVAADLRTDDRVVTESGAALSDWLHGHAARNTDARPFAERVIEAVSGAAADRLRRNGRVTVIFDGRGNAAAPEARALAAEARLPVLFVEDRQEAAGGAAVRSDAANPGIITIPVDAQDVIAVYRVAHESMTRAREGTGPTTIRCLTWPAAVGRKPAAAETTDAVRQLEEWLAARGLPAQQWRAAVLAEFEKQAGTAQDRVPAAKEEGAAAAHRNETAFGAPQTLA